MTATLNDILVQIAVRYLRGCYISGDLDALDRSGVSVSHYHMLADPDFFRPRTAGNRSCSPPAHVTVSAKWSEMLTALKSPPTVGSRPTLPFHEIQLVMDLMDHAALAFISSDFDRLGELGITANEVNLFRNYSIEGLVKLQRCPVSVSVMIDASRSLALDRRRHLSHSATADCLRLIQCQATFDLMVELLGMTTRDYASARKLAGVSLQRRIPNRTTEEEHEIHRLLNEVCGSRRPQLDDYLQICKMTANTCDLGKVYAEVRIRWPDG